jgi:hypothetical protein
MLGVWNDSVRVLLDPDAFHRPVLQEHQARLHGDVGRRRTRNTRLLSGRESGETVLHLVQALVRGLTSGRVYY